MQVMYQRNEHDEDSARSNLRRH